MSNSTYCEDHYEQPDWMKKIQGLEKQNKELRELLTKKEKESIDKEKIRKEVERLRKIHQMKYQQLDADNSMSLVECGKRNLCNELLSFIDSLQEEPKKCMYTKDDFTEEDRKILCEDCEEECEYAKKEEPVSEDLEKEFSRFLDEKEGVPRMRRSEEQLKWALDIARHFAEWQKTKDESCSKDLGEYINELSKQFPEVSFAKLSRIAVRVAKWQKENLWKPADCDDLPEIDREVIAILDNGKVVFAHRPPEYWDGKNIITGKVTRNYPKTYDKGGWNIPNIKYWLDVELPKEIEL